MADATISTIPSTETPDFATLRTGDPGWPDDPRDCCREISKRFHKEIYEFPNRLAPEALADLAEMVGRIEEDDFFLLTKALKVLADLSQDVLKEYERDASAIHMLARHGTKDFRDIDRDIKDRELAREAAQ